MATSYVQIKMCDVLVLMRKIPPRHLNIGLKCQKSAEVFNALCDDVQCVVCGDVSIRDGIGYYFPLLRLNQNT